MKGHTSHYGLSYQQTNRSTNCMMLMLLSKAHIPEEGVQLKGWLEADMEGHQPSSAAPPSPPVVPPSPPVVTFVEHAKGKICSDGGDILEGQVDGWDDCEAHPQVGQLCRLTQKCREKCRSRARCKFYSLFSNGWCQLSTHCGTTVWASNGQVTTFRKPLA